MAKRPNIVIFNPDQMRADCLAHLGDNPAALTPFLDQMVSTDAVSYRHAYCQNPVCVPSRCSFLTGLYPHVRGHRTMRYMLHQEESSLFSELRNAGYYVWMSSRNDFLPAQDQNAFSRHADEVFYGGDCPPAPGTVIENPRGEPGNKNYYSFYRGELKTDANGRNYSRDDETVDAAIKRIQTPLKDDKPLCLFVALSWPHPPYTVEKPYFSEIDKAKLPPRVKFRKEGSHEPKIETLIRKYQQLDEYTDEDWDHIRTTYAGMCAKVDDQFHRLCDALKAAGMYEDTAIFFFSDHGDYQGQFGLTEKNQNTFEEGLIRVPMLIKPPKGTPVDVGISDSMVELVDFYATAMDFAGIKPDHTHFGCSLRQSIADRSLPVRDFVCCEGGRLAGEVHCDESHADNPEGTKPFFEYYPRQKAMEDDVAHGKATMLRTEKYKYIRRLYEKDQLFDMEKDPGEQKDLIDDPNMQQVVTDMSMKMLDWYQETCDIVPFELDKRQNGEMIWARIKHSCPPSMKEQVIKMVENTSALQLIQTFSKMFAEKNNPGQKNKQGEYHENV